MLFILLGLILVVLAFGPQYWVRHIIRKHHTPLENMPGTGAELAEHLIERFKLEGVKVQETGPDQNYYSPAEKDRWPVSGCVPWQIPFLCGHCHP